MSFRRAAAWALNRSAGYWPTRTRPCPSIRLQAQPYPPTLSISFLLSLKGSPYTWLGVASPERTDTLVDACGNCRPGTLRRKISDQGLPFLPGARYDDNRSMPLWGNSLGKLGATGGHTRVLVQGVPIYRCRQRNGQCLLPYSGVQGDRPDQRLSKCRGQWQSNAPAILPFVRNAALQRGRGASSSDLRSRWHFRRSESSQSCNDDLDVICATLGMHQRRVAASGEATTASSVMSDA